MPRTPKPRPLTLARSLAFLVRDLQELSLVGGDTSRCCLDLVSTIVGAETAITVLLAHDLRSLPSAADRDPSLAGVRASLEKHLAQCLRIVHDAHTVTTNFVASWVAVRGFTAASVKSSLQNKESDLRSPVEALQRLADRVLANTLRPDVEQFPDVRRVQALLHDDQRSESSAKALASAYSARRAGGGQSLSAAGRPVHCVEWSPDGRWLAAGLGQGGGERAGLVIWGATSDAAQFVDASALSDAADGDDPKVVDSISWRPDSCAVALAWGSSVLLWNMPKEFPEAKDGEVHRVHAFEDSDGNPTDMVSSIAWSPNGKALAVCTVTGKLVMRGQYSSYEWTRGAKCMAWSPNGSWLAVGTGGGKYKVLLWRVGTDGHRQICESQESVTSIAWHPSCGHLATASRDAVILWTVRGEFLARCSQERVDRGLVAMSNDERHMAFADRGGVVKSDMQSGDGGSGEGGLSGLDRVRDLAFSADGFSLAVACVRNGNEMVVLKGSEKVLSARDL